MVSVDVKHHVYLQSESHYFRAQELCESRGGRPNKLTVSVDVKQHSTNHSESPELRSSGRPGLPSLISLMASVDVKQHFNQPLRITSGMRAVSVLESRK